MKASKKYLKTRNNGNARQKNKYISKSVVRF